VAFSSLKSGNPTSGAIERYFNVALFFLVLTGFLMLGATGALDLPALAIVGLALMIRGYSLLARLDLRIPESWATLLTLIYVLIYFADYLFLSGSFLTATIHLVLFLIVMRLFSLQRPRDHYLLAVLAFLMVLASAVLTVGAAFVFAFAAFLFVAVLTFVLMEMRHSLGGAGQASASKTAQALAVESEVPGRHRRMAYSLVAIAPALMVLILVCSFFIFFFLPRVSSRYLTAYAPTSDVSTGFSDHLQLGRIGQIQQSNAVVMHIEIDNDAQGLYDLKWRGVALSTFDGQSWSNSFGSTQIPLSGVGVYRLGRPDSGGPINSRRQIHYRVLMEPLGTNVFFLAEKPRALLGNYRPVAIDSGGAIYNLDLEHPISRYEGFSDLPDVAADALRVARSDAAERSDAYLQLPPIDLRISRLAEQITGGSSNNYDKALAIEQYLRAHFGYTLELPRTRPRDPLAHFLFERKQGHCEYFASSMAVMLRALGIPSRIVNGFRGGEFNDLTGQYVIRASNAHSWVEAFFPGYGWVSFDPTPAGNLSTHNGWSRIQLYVDAAASFWREWIINYDSRHQRELGQTAANNTRRFLDDTRAWIERQHRKLLRVARRAHHQIADFPARWLGSAMGAVLLLMFVSNSRSLVKAWRAKRLRANPHRSPRESAALWYERMAARLERFGWRKSPSQTPADFVAAIQEPELRTKVAVFTRHYESARFGESVEDAKVLPGLFEEIIARDESGKRVTPG